LGGLKPWLCCNSILANTEGRTSSRNDFAIYKIYSFYVYKNKTCEVQGSVFKKLSIFVILQIGLNLGESSKLKIKLLFVDVWL